MFSNTFFKPVLIALREEFGRTYNFRDSVKMRYSPNKRLAVLFFSIDEPANNFPLYQPFLVRNEGETVSRSPGMCNLLRCHWSNDSSVCAFSDNSSPSGVMLWDPLLNFVAPIRKQNVYQDKISFVRSAVVFTPVVKGAGRKAGRKRATDTFDKLRWKPAIVVAQPKAGLKGLSLEGSILYTCHEFRDLSHEFYLVVQDRGDKLSLLRLPQRDTDASSDPETASMGFAVPVMSKNLKRDLTKRVLRKSARRIRGKIRDAEGAEFLVWAGDKKAYRYV